MGMTGIVKMVELLALIMEHGLTPFPRFSQSPSKLVHPDAASTKFE
jgi:hypothetical protein